MSDTFDPYRVWLGIPPDSRPPTHYQLLGISPNETEQAVIEAAVLRQGGYVRNFQVGKYAKDAARVLSEIAAAKACLLDPVKRAKYDVELRARKPAAANPGFQAVTPVDRAPLAPTLPAIDLDLLAASAAPVVYGPRAAGGSSAPQLLRKGKRSKQPPIVWLAAIGVGAAVLIAVTTIVFFRRLVDAQAATIGEPVVINGTVQGNAGNATFAPPEVEAVPLPPPAVAPFSAKEAQRHQERWAKYLRREVEETNSIGMKLVLIPPGEFMMGLSDAQADEYARDLDRVQPPEVESRTHADDEWPRHLVRLTKPFLLCTCETTVDQFRRFADHAAYKTDAERSAAGGSGFVDGLESNRPGFCWRNMGEFTPADQTPAVDLSWNDAAAFCRWLSEKEGKRYRLPTEAEWEFACRAGTESKWFFGEEPFDTPLLEDYAWYGRNSGCRPHLVAMKRANPFGLYDVYGNAEEWCHDWYGSDYYGFSPQVDPAGPENGTERVLRSGQFCVWGGWQHSASRTRAPPAGPFRFFHGFRVLCEIGPIGAADQRHRQIAPAATPETLPPTPSTDPALIANFGPFKGRWHVIYPDHDHRRIYIDGDGNVDSGPLHAPLDAKVGWRGRLSGDGDRMTLTVDDKPLARVRVEHEMLLVERLDAQQDSHLVPAGTGIGVRSEGTGGGQTPAAHASHVRTGSDAWADFELHGNTIVNDFARLPKTALSTRQAYSGPLDVSIIARTDKDNIRLFAYGLAALIFSWETDLKQLNVATPNGATLLRPATPLARNAWYRLRWSISERSLEVFVEDELVFQERGEFNLTMANPVWVAGGINGSTIDVKSFSVVPMPSVGIDTPSEIDGAKGGATLVVAPSFDIAKSWRLSVEFWAPTFPKDRHVIFFWGDERAGHDAMSLELEGFSLRAAAAHGMRESGDVCPVLGTRLSGVHSRRWLATRFEYNAATNEFLLFFDGKRVAQQRSRIAPTIDQPMPVYLCHAHGQSHFTGRVRNARLENLP